MSQSGIKKMAEVFRHLQQVRHELLEMGTSGKLSDPSHQQDIRLANLCEDMKDAVSKRFSEITVEV